MIQYIFLKRDWNLSSNIAPPLIASFQKNDDKKHRRISSSLSDKTSHHQGLQNYKNRPKACPIFNTG